MRFVGIALVLLLAACASASTAGLPAPEPMGNLAQVMRGILFTNSNILFDVQSSDPDDPPPVDAGAGATTRFSASGKRSPPASTRRVIGASAAPWKGTSRSGDTSPREISPA